uniref:Uncharacterized protein n=1 Tax=Ananas comosus var. bracteatus TaxID=296719 RepID=A0A6V7PL76_ANACO|nr:unnamed protein product [Ananas comosus var. bracteatus]
MGRIPQPLAWSKAFFGNVRELNPASHGDPRSLRPSKDQAIRLMRDRISRTFWWVVDSVPTYGSSPENCVCQLGTKIQKFDSLDSSRVSLQQSLYRNKVGLVPVQGLMVVPYSHRACTGTEPQTPRREPRVCIFVGLVPVQEPVYRYKEADFVQFELQGCFCFCSLSFSTPRPLGLLLSSDHREGKVGHPSSPSPLDLIPFSWILED